MVRHYVRKHDAWQPTIWSTPIFDGSYKPTYKPTFLDAPKEAEVLGYIYDMNGEAKQPGSKEEYRVYQALTYFKIPFYYQYSIEGGRSVAGGQIIDFYCITPPKNTLIYVQGTYWHSGTKGMERQLNIAEASAYFNGEVNVVELWDYEVSTVDDTIAKVKERVI
jgi:hypothetical protein